LQNITTVCYFLDFYEPRLTLSGVSTKRKARNVRSAHKKVRKKLRNKRNYDTPPKKNYASTVAT